MGGTKKSLFEIRKEHNKHKTKLNGQIPLNYHSKVARRTKYSKLNCRFEQ